MATGEPTKAGPCTKHCSSTDAIFSLVGRDNMDDLTGGLGPYAACTLRRPHIGPCMLGTASTLHSAHRLLCSRQQNECVFWRCRAHRPVLGVGCLLVRGASRAVMTGSGGKPRSSSSATQAVAHGCLRRQVHPWTAACGNFWRCRTRRRSTSDRSPRYPGGRGVVGESVPELHRLRWPVNVGLVPLL